MSHKIEVSGCPISGRFWSGFREGGVCGSYPRATPLSLSWILHSLCEGGASRSQVGGASRDWRVGLPGSLEDISIGSPIRRKN